MSRDDSKPVRIEERLAEHGGAIEFLRAPAALFGGVVAARGWLYDRGWLPSHRVDVPVVCVGNLTAGGTGKSPFVEWLARWFEQRGWRAGLLMRGYAAKPGEDGDEARMLAEHLPDVPLVQDADRVRGAWALAERGVDVILLDDGFQHRRLRRDRDLVLVDATRPWGLPGREGLDPVCSLLPRGLLREPPRALGRADAVVITRSDQIDPDQLERLRTELASLSDGAPIVTARHAPVGLEGVSDATRWSLEELADRTVDLVSGIGNPAAFERTVESLGADVREHRRFPDHHAYSGADLAGLGKDGVAVVTTAKDAVKLSELLPGALSLEVEFELTAGSAPLVAQLESIPPGPRQRERRAMHEGLHG